MKYRNHRKNNFNLTGHAKKHYVRSFFTLYNESRNINWLYCRQAFPYLLSYHFLILRTFIYTYMYRQKALDQISQPQRVFISDVEDQLQIIKFNIEILCQPF